MNNGRLLKTRNKIYTAYILKLCIFTPHFKTVAMKKIILSLSALLLLGHSYSQSIKKIINPKEVKRIEKILSADDMEGRRSFTPGVAKASAFIEEEFKKIGLETFNGVSGYRQDFFVFESTVKSVAVTIDGKAIADTSVAVFSYTPHVHFTQGDNIEVVSIGPKDNPWQKFSEYYRGKKNRIVLVDTTHYEMMKRIGSIDKITEQPDSASLVFIFGVQTAGSFDIDIVNNVEKKALNNVVGVLKGKTRPDEYVIFSGHYDHIGIGSPGEGMPHTGTDSIYNGANDDAAGTTAVIMLAKYFKALNNNDRTLIFATFTAEEIGGYGSRYFSKQLPPEKVMAMFNIEMIGTESKWGRNSAYITGFEKSDMGKILQKNLEGTQFQFYPDPYTDQQLFYRSDNATLARLGVPAHTISTSKMDNEPNYHKVSDQIETLDMKNMAEIIKALAVSAKSIISGADTPSRVDTKQLK